MGRRGHLAPPKAWYRRRPVYVLPPQRQETCLHSPVKRHDALSAPRCSLTLWAEPCDSYHG
jgi:hypothetical protein